MLHDRLIHDCGQLMNEQSKRWLIEKIAQEPDFLATYFLPALERLVPKAETARDQANRTGTIEEIKYRMGWLDGVRESCAVLDGLKKSFAKNPDEPGLMARILGKGS